MNWGVPAELWGLLNVAVGALLGAVLTMYASSRSSDRSLKKAQRVSFLIDAYRVIEDSSLRVGGGYERDFEKAMASIHLLGDEDNVAEAEKVFRSAKATGQVDVKDLLVSLRRSLRKELGLKHISDEFFHIRLQ